MGRLAEFTEEQIIDAGLTLQSFGTKVSPFSIRESLGGGDPKRIKVIWEAFIEREKNQSEVNQTRDNIELPHELTEYLEKSFVASQKQLKAITLKLFKSATCIAEKRVNSTIEEFNSKLSEFENSEKDAFLYIAKCDKKVAKLETIIKELEQKNELLLAENAKQSGIVELLNSRVKTLEKNEEEFHNLQSENAHLRGQIQALTKQ